MTRNEADKKLAISQAELARLGGGNLAYIREIGADTAQELLGDSLGEAMTISSDQRLFCLYLGDGTPVAISGSREAALANAFEHDLLPMSVH
jgi:hypothetical protein